MVEATENRKSFKEALQEKYSDDSFDAKLNYINMSPRREALSKCHVLDFSKRKVLSLDDCDISCAGLPGDIAKLCPNLEELDLSKNNINNWKEVFSIISQLLYLKCLNLSSNPLSSNETDVTNVLKEICTQDGIAPIKQLVLNNTGIPLQTVYELLTCIPGVEALFLSLNEYSSVPHTDHTFTSVKHLYLNQHALTDWTEIIKLSTTFPQLEELIMTEAPLETILPTDASNFFPKLRILKLNKTAINSWEHIEALNSFPLLADVRLLGIPLVEPYSAKEQRQLLIAHLPNVTKLNGTKVGGEEREDAERCYIRHHMDDLTLPQRYHQLIKVHGNLDRLAEVDLDPKTITKVTVRYEDCAPFKLDLNLKQTLKELKKLLSNELGIPSNKMQLWNIDPVAPYGPCEMKALSNPLHYFKVYDGCEILVQRKGF